MRSYRLLRDIPVEFRAIARERLERWVAANDVKLFGGAPPCLRVLRYPHHSCRAHPGGCVGVVDRPQVLDHVEWWRCADGSWVLTAHPYGESGDDMTASLGEHQRAELEALGGSLGITPEVDEDASWYYPGWTVLVTLRGREACTVRAADGGGVLRRVRMGTQVEDGG